jgi:predicted dehydrogenase
MSAQPASKAQQPRLAFLGVGWIGRNRLEAIAQSGCARIVAVGDSTREVATEAVRDLPEARVVDSLDALLAINPDGVVIATPSGLHAPQAVAALKQGAAVFCQKPLARAAHETQQVIDAAKRADRLLSVDFCYRLVHGMPRLRELVRTGELGRIYAVDLVFHNAYGPDKSWFYNLAQSGGGCVMDLGIHLVDLALWVLDFPSVTQVSSRLYAQGAVLAKPVNELEDFAVAQFELEGGATARMACSWRLSAGQDAVIEVSFYGTRGGARLRNISGSFYDFSVERFNGTARETLGAYPDAWGGRTILTWAQHLARDPRFDPDVQHVMQVAEVVDAVYGR